MITRHKLKYNEHGGLDRYKCRLVAQRYSHTEGIDYEESFAPVARFNTIRTLLALGLNRGMIMEQMDVVTAILNGTLKEDIYMSQPEGFVTKGKETLVCHLRKSLYGLKQSPRCWYEELSEYLTGIAPVNQCVFFRWRGSDLTIVMVYVDDLILLVDLIDLTESLTDRFRMQDLGPLNYCLGISIKQSNGEIQIHQKQYITNMLQKFAHNPVNHKRSKHMT